MHMCREPNDSQYLITCSVLVLYFVLLLHTLHTTTSQHEKQSPITSQTKSPRCNHRNTATPIDQIQRTQHTMETQLQCLQDLISTNTLTKSTDSDVLIRRKVQFWLCAKQYKTQHESINCKEVLTSKARENRVPPNAIQQYTETFTCSQILTSTTRKQTYHQMLTSVTREQQT